MGNRYSPRTILTDLQADSGKACPPWRRQSADAGRQIAPLTIATLKLLDRLKSDIGNSVDQLATVTAQNDEFSDTENRLLADINIGCAVFAIIAMMYAFRSILRALDSGLEAKQQVDQLFLMDSWHVAERQGGTRRYQRSTPKRPLATLMPGVWRRALRVQQLSRPPGPFYELG